MSTGSPGARRGRRPRPERASTGGRKALAILVPILALVVIALGLLWASSRGDTPPAATTPKTVDVLFIEGLRRTEMAQILQQ